MKRNKANCINGSRIQMEVEADKTMISNKMQTKNILKNLNMFLFLSSFLFQDKNRIMVMEHE